MGENPMKLLRGNIRLLTLITLLFIASFSVADHHLKLAHGALASNNFTDAIALFTKAADSGDAEGQYQLALLYATGQGIEADMTIAHELMNKAAAQNNSEAVNWLVNHSEEEENPEDDC
jgi:TPR repeat protein